VEPKRRWNVFFEAREPAGKRFIVPFGNNPVECCNLESLLVKLSQNSPRFFESSGVELVGVRVEEVRNEKDL